MVLINASSGIRPENAMPFRNLICLSDYPGTQKFSRAREEKRRNVREPLGAHVRSFEWARGEEAKRERTSDRTHQVFWTSVRRRGETWENLWAHTSGPLNECETKRRNVREALGAHVTGPLNECEAKRRNVREPLIAHIRSFERVWGEEAKRERTSNHTHQVLWTSVRRRGETWENLRVHTLQVLWTSVRRRGETCPLNERSAKRERTSERTR